MITNLQLSRKSELREFPCKLPVGERYCRCNFRTVAKSQVSEEPLCDTLYSGYYSDTNYCIGLATNLILSPATFRTTYIYTIDLSSASFKLSETTNYLCRLKYIIYLYKKKTLELLPAWVV